MAENSTDKAHRVRTALTLPPRLPLARLPTPVERLERLSDELGVTLLIKRDDLTGMELSGNKIRKLEFLLAEARDREATAVLTTGGIQSNHCRATAIAARRLGMQPYLMLHSSNGGPPPETDGNQLLDRLVGAEIRYIGSEQYRSRDILMARWADELSENGGSPYLIPEGASNALGALGYVAMVEELIGQIEAGEVPDGLTPDSIVHACGSGGTSAGLAVGCHVLGLPTRVDSYSVSDDAATFRERIDGIIEDIAERYLEVADTQAVRYDVLDDYRGAGYAESTPEEISFLQEIARRDALLLDPVYTGKAFRGLVEEIRHGDRYPPRSTVLFVHTGGLFGLFPMRRELSFGGDEPVRSGLNA